MQAIVLTVIAGIASLLAISSSGAATLYHGGDILTMAGDQPAYVEALVADGPTIAFTGDLARAQAAYPGADAVDLAGRTLMPGFIDAHSHLIQTAAKLSTVSLDPPPAGDVSSIADIRHKLVEALTSDPRGPDNWLVGWGFDNGMLSDGRFPNRSDLDQVSTTVPIVLVHFSSHMLVLNSAGLARAGYDDDYQPPPGGAVRRDPDGRINGVIEETAMLPAFATLTRDVLGPDAGLRLGLPLRDEDMLKLILQAQDIYLSEGFTTISDFASSPDDLVLLRQLRDAGALKADVVAHVHSSTAPVEQIGQWYSPDYDRHLRVGGGKINLDGGSPGRTAFLRRPYHTPTPGHPASYRGYSSIPDQGELNRLVASYYRQGTPIFIHALGDAAVDQCIAAVAYAELKHPGQDRRTQLIHLQQVEADQFDRLATLDVSLTFQIAHNYYFADFHEQYIYGPERTASLNAMGTAFERGFSTTFHHDSPVHPVDQMTLIWAAVNRLSRSGRIYGEDQRLTVYQALRAATIEGARQFHEEARKGSLEPGKLADMIVLDRNPLKTDPAQLRELTVLVTIKEGSAVYRRQAPAQ